MFGARGRVCTYEVLVAQAFYKHRHYSVSLMSCLPLSNLDTLSLINVYYPNEMA